MVLLISGLVCDQLPPLELTMYPPCPMLPKLNPKFLLSTTFLWHMPTASQLLVDSLIWKAKSLLSFSREGSMMANL